MEYNPLFETQDDLPRMLYNAYTHGADHLAETSNPCSICRNQDGFGDEGTVSKTTVHFHGSDFGACQKRVYLTKLNKLKVDNGNRNNFLMDGHRHEASIFEYIQAAPTKLDIHACVNNKEIMKQFDAYNFLLVGHPDGFVARPNIVNHHEEYEAVALIECKAVSDTTYKKCKENFISDVWYGQMQAYMSIYDDIEVCYLIVKHRGTSDILMPFRIERNGSYIKSRLESLGTVSSALTNGVTVGTINRERPNAKDAECSVCPFKQECWGNR